jgi:hypothetical protein
MTAVLKSWKESDDRERGGGARSSHFIFSSTFFVAW